ncbi:IS6 family transposase, partial [Vibrio vulnificus]|nr:IS6 family transposase [Vibrio vulnificus]MCU8173061.1 IS6 family transposase [Vibrio vulnificus]
MDFSGYQHPKDIILLAVRYYASYKELSYRDIEEILAERGSHIDHSTINRWVINFA